ncbi:MAG: RNA polymerase sigma factor, partial [Phycisphaerae bacterium]
MSNVDVREECGLRTRDDQRDTAEEALVQGAGSGDTEAFGRLVHLYQRRAVSLAYRLLGDGQDAADVSQDAFVRAYENLGQLQDASRFGPWLMKIVSNLSLNFRRARATRATATLDEEAETPDKLRFPRGDRLATMPSDAAE